MAEREQAAELLDFFKALADANRLKIVGLLAADEMSVEELAAVLDLRPSTVSHHLRRLADAGLVRARAEGYYNMYRLNIHALEVMARRLLSEEALAQQAVDVDLDAYDRKVLENFLTPEGRLKAIPAQYKKLMAILRYLLRAFEPGKRYPEKEVNRILGQYHEDTARLRRELVEAGLMAREGGGGEYWRVK